MKKILLAALATVLFTVPAQALFELRAGYGVNTPSEDTISTETLKTMAGFNLDAIAEIPLLPFGLGLRYESMGADVSSTVPATNALGLESDFERISLLVNYRIIDLFAYLGVIGTIGISNEFTVKGTGIADVEYDASTTFSIGVEGGVSLGLIMLGAELGYLSADMERKSGTGSNADLSGTYAKAIVGVGF